MFSEDDAIPSRLVAGGLFLPFILLAAGVLFSSIWQITDLQTQRSNLRTTKAQIADALQKREPQAAQAAQIKASMEALGNDLLELAKTNANAETIVKKYDIQRNLAAAEAAK